MLKSVPLLLTISLCVSMSACGNSPTEPSPGENGRYDGQWSGTTFQGRPITFTVSSEQKVTSITIGYNFNGCSASNTFSNLNLDIGNPPSPTAPSLGPSFGFGSGSPEGSNYIQILGSFTASTRATGSVIFGSFPACGTSLGPWSATKR